MNTFILPNVRNIFIKRGLQEILIKLKSYLLYQGIQFFCVSLQTNKSKPWYENKL